MVEVEHLTVGYGDTVVLEDLDFAVPRGDVFAILGGSGSVARALRATESSSSRARSSAR